MKKLFFALLALAALCILVFSPSALYSVGFQLSFITVGAILLFARLPQRLECRHRWVNSLTSTVITSLVAMLATVALSAHYFHTISLMSMLAKKFPRVFKPQPVGKKQRPQKADTPWDFYNRVTATIQKYIGGLSSHDVDDQPYGVTLQQLEMMADEAAELERAKSRHP